MYSMYVNASKFTPSYTHVSLMYEESTPCGSNQQPKLDVELKAPTNTKKKCVRDNKVERKAHFILIVP